MNTILKNGEKWFDTDGNIIHAHGGGIIKKDDIYYWYGEDRNGDNYVSYYVFHERAKRGNFVIMF